MPDPDPGLFVLPRDGSSQADRLVAALAPEAAPVDEREPADTLAFLQRYAAKLNFYNLRNEVDGDWSAFLASVANPAKLAQVAAFLANPADFPDRFYDVWHRPHFALLLTFLDLLRPVRDQVNTFTRRQLDFYYREMLGFQPRPAGSGQVHVIIVPEARRSPFLLPAGTLLDAGRDAQGGAVHYRTDADLVVTTAQVQQFRSLFLQRTVVGLDDVRRDPDALLPFLKATPDWHGMTPRSPQDYPADKTFQALLEMALGDPNPGDPLPVYAPDPRGDTLADRDLYGALDPLLARIRATDGLAMGLPTFRRLMGLRRGLGVSPQEIAAQWSPVNAALQTAGRKKRADPTYTLPLPPQPDDFITNLKTALGFSDTAYAVLYDELPEVNDVYGLYYHLQDDAARQFVTTTLAFASVDDFAAMMAIVDGFYQQWQQVLEILRGAGRRKQSVDPGHVIAPPNLRAAHPGADLWTSLLQGTLGDTGALLQVSGKPITVARNPIATLDAADAEVQRLEQFFYLPADDFTTVRAALGASGSTPAWAWDEVDAILVAARLGKETAKREAELQAARLGTTDPGTGVQRMLAKTLSLVNLSDSTADQASLLRPEEARTLQQISASTGTVNWDLVASILNEARGRKESWQPPALEFESWDNLYAAPDATAVRSTPAGSPVPRWRTFGDGPRPDGATAAASFGFMIASPLLALAEGTRTITLTLEFTAASAGFQSEAIEKVLGQPDGPFRCLLSTAKDPVEILPAPADITWTPSTLNPVAGAVPLAPTLRFILRIDEQAPPIVPSTDAAVPISAPFLQVLLRDLPDPASIAAPQKKRFEAFAPLILTGVKLKVDVEGLTSLLLQNDDGDLLPQKPFEPFGHLPGAGSRFLFAHAEICTKQLDQLQVGFEWLGLPTNLDLADWYRSYFVPPTSSPITSNLSFVARLALYDQRAFRYLLDVPIFGGGTLAATPLDPTAPPTSLMQVTSPQITAAYKTYGPAPGARVGDGPLDSDRYWFLELKRPDFLHSIYPQTATQQAINRSPVIINPPYTPRVRRMFVNYQASVDVRLTGNGPDATHQLFYIEPFGCRYVDTSLQTLPGDTVPSAVGPWLPRDQDADGNALEGQLCIGVAGVAAPQNLSLLFQLAAGSADPDVTLNPILWHYLSGDEWLPLDDGRLLSDATHGFVNSGIVELDLPAAQPSRRLPGGLYWIRLATTRNSRGVCDVIDVRTQAVTASLAPDSAGASVLVLAPDTIASLAQSRPEVKAVQQPYSPFAARPPEETPHFAARVSERLRHKGRALTCWDYERLILESFPDVHRVKCLSVDSSDDPREPTVRVIVIPDMRGKQPFDPFAPKAPADVLRSIEDFLADRCAAGTVYRVQNPRFCSLRLRCSVRLLPGCNPGFYFPLLNDELCRFLSPWAYDNSADIVFGGRISANSIVYFIEQRSYIDYVTDLKLFLIMDGQEPKPVTDQSSDLASLTGAPDIILVSALQHQIDPISDQYTSTSFVGIDYMKLGLDFSVA